MIIKILENGNELIKSTALSLKLTALGDKPSLGRDFI